MSQQNTATTGLSDDEMIKMFFEAVMEAFNEKANDYVKNAGTDKAERFKRVTAVKEGLKSIGEPDTFGIKAGSYSSCTTGECVGGVCSKLTAFGDEELAALAEKLGINPTKF